jgi:hypothetical protein
MSYSYVKAIVKSKGRGERWREEDVRGMTLASLLNNHVNGRIELTHPVLTEPQTLTLDTMRPLVGALNVTVEEWLVSLGDRSLPTTTGSVALNTKTATNIDAWMAGFDVEPARMGSHPDNVWGKEQMVDLLLTRDATDYDDLYRHCLVTVNGLVHRTSASEAGLYVVKGARSQVDSNQTNVALTSFADIAPLQFVDLNRDMLYRPNPEVKSYQQAYLNLGVPTENRSVLLVIGGYLHLLDDVYQSIGDGLLKIDFNAYPMVQRYYESRTLIDLSTLPLSTFDQNESQRDVNELIRSEATIEALLDLDETFAVVVASDSLYVVKHQVEKSGLVGTFISQTRPLWPLRTQRGKLKEYWAYEDDGCWVINCQSNLLPNYQFEHTHYETLASITDARIPSAPRYQDRGFLLEIGKDL